MNKCYRNWEPFLMPSPSTLSLCTCLLLSILLSPPTCATENNNSHAPKAVLSDIFDALVSPSYVVNISICGALDMQNNTHWFQPCTPDQIKNSTKHNNNTDTIASLSCILHNYTGTQINHTKVLLETYLAVPLLTHMLSYFCATTAAFLDFIFFGGLAGTAYYYRSPALLLYSPLALIFLVVFIRRLTLNILALRFAWTRHTNFIIDQKGRLFVNHDDVLIEGPNGVKLADKEVRVATVVLGGRKAHLLRSAHAEEWSW
uniref:GP5 protein n=1 Tax=Mikumi yellow baboon virus 1 TaxID=1546177 RepID=A0A089G0G4_9NIDO|nr:GP5 protein [Mikumi yellow baboon virus 1]